METPPKMPESGPAARVAVSVIVPVYREQARINDLVARVRALDRSGQCEIIVVDGEPGGVTAGVVQDRRVRCLQAPKGRAAQMNVGARVARGDTLLFLHADTTLPGEAFDRVREVAQDPALVGGAFSFAYDSHRRILRLFGWFSNWRCRITRLPFGDQAIFVDRDYFFTVGGFPEVPVMEDFELVRRIKRHGGRICILGEPVRTSPRRIEHEGLVYSAIRSGAMMLLYSLGVAPSRLKQYYPDGIEDERSDEAGSNLFCKQTEAGPKDRLSSPET